MALKNIMRNNGIPYQGSKQLIAPKIMEQIQAIAGNRKYFYDLCGGGGAMSFTAYLNGYNVIYNEINKDIAQLMKFIVKNNETCEYGNLPKNYYDFVNREKFFEIKDQKKITPYKTFVLICYSFGNAKKTYFCNRDLEPFKKEGHNFIIFLDYKNFNHYKELYKKQIHILDEMYKKIKELKNWNDRRLIFVNILLKIEAIRVAELEDVYKKYDFNELYNLSCKNIVDTINLLRPNIALKTWYEHHPNELKEIKQIRDWQPKERLQELQHIERIEQLKKKYLLMKNLTN